jgi:Pyruvate/2-oxoacid:ferredoxin oxidoreductase gamma subunit
VKNRFALYLISQADFVGCHQLQFIDKYQMVERLKPGGIFLLNTPYGVDEVWSRLPQEAGDAEPEKSALLYCQRREDRPRAALAPVSTPSCRWHSSI